MRPSTVPWPRPGVLGSAPVDARAPESRSPPAAHRISLLYGASAVVLIGWGTYLGASLPAERVAHHWNIAWVALDVLIVVALAATAICAHRRDPSIVLPAIATATLLVADAVMDVSTANRSDLWEALVLALVLELPLAALSVRIAWRTIDALSGADAQAPRSSSRARHAGRPP